MPLGIERSPVGGGSKSLLPKTLLGLGGKNLPENLWQLLGFAF